MKKIKVTRKKYVERVEGDIWEESGKTWTIKNGIKRTVTKMDKARKDFLVPLACPCCGKKMNNRLDAKFWKTDRKCFDCVVWDQHKLRAKGLKKEFNAKKKYENAKTYLKEVKAGLQEFKESSAENTHVSEKGKIEKWANPDNKIMSEYIDKEIEKLEEIVGKLKDKIDGEEKQPKGE
jgi:ribosomal protein L37AE/L43A|tara:strand:- start:1654 stop:2187 length:534 start_codon:yes stop_codon:yes gene_type:complete